MIPPEANAGFVAAMEDVLETYQRPRDPDRPLVCLDETSKQLIAETRAPIPAKPGQPARHDYEYERNGVANLFMIFAPLEGWRRVEVTDRHAAVDYAKVLKDLSDVHFPAAEKIVLVQDNLSTHAPASLYAASPPPKPAASSKGSNGITRPSTEAGSTWPIGTRRSDQAVPKPSHPRQADPRERSSRLGAPPNKHHAKADWQFTTENARVKLKRLYPQF